jgi:hypothetical protein
MALWNIATDLQTRETIWVSTNVVAGRRQLNSHSSECYQREGIDGYPAWDLAGLHTDYTGNDWQSKHLDFITKWSEVE